MIFTETPLPGVHIIDLERRGDDRGFFARAFCAREFEDHGLVARFVQANMSRSPRAGTLRGLHYQQAPHEETKLMRCVEGALWEIVVDARPTSPTYLQSFGCELSPENGRALYVPKGFANGFLTLKPDTVAFYMVDAFYAPGAEEGFRHDDPALELELPIPVTEVSEKDRGWPLIART